MSKTGFLRIALVTLVVLLIQGTWALAGTTGSISGKVTDQNGNGVTGAKVTASSPAQSQNVTSGSNGFYSILNLSPDTYSVTASKDGFDTSTVYGITVAADQSTSADLKMQSTVKTIGHITTTATASVVNKTVTGDLYAVNAQAISGYQGSQGGAETLYSQNGVVGSLPGVVRYAVGTGGGYGGQGQLSLRGGGPDQVGYELDGVPLNRGFDFYNGTAFVTNGLASLQVYTGGAPADAGRAMSGYINQVFQRGKYPGGADFTGVIGGPLFNHTVQADVYGATPDSHFTYYVSTLATNAYFNFGDRSNLANTSFTVPAGDPNCGAFNMGLTPASTTGTGVPGSGNTLNCAQANILNQPVAQGSYGSTPFNAGRDTAANLHWGFTHNGLNDDLQALYVTGTTLSAPFGMYGTASADPSQASANYSGDGVGPNNSLTWPTGHFYYGVVGQAFDPTLRTALTWPTSGGSVSGVIPPTFQDSQITQYSIEKLGYTRALSQASFLRLYGYAMYSAWSLDQPINGIVGSSFYQLHDNATGVTLNYQNQINQQNLIKLIGDWSRDLTLRYNYFNYTGRLRCEVGGVATPCAPGTIVTQVQGPASNWSTVTPVDWDGVIADSWKPSDKLLFDLGLRWDQFGFQLMPMKINGPDGIAYLSEEQNGVCLRGFNYSPSDPRIIGPGGNQNCFDILTAPGTPAKDQPGGGAWQDASGTLLFRTISPRFGATWSVDPRDVIRFSVGRYVQPPNSAFEQYRNAPFWGPGTTVARLNTFYDALGFTVVHNAQPEDSTNYDLSFEHEFNGGVSLKLTPYYRNTRNQVLNIPVNPQSPSFVTGFNFGNARIKGAEFLITKNVMGTSGIGGTLAATYTDSKVRFNRPAVPGGGGASYIDDMNGVDANGNCLGIGICGYNQAYGTNYALLDPNGFYSPSFVQAPTSTGPSWDVRWVINLSLDARAGGFDFMPTFNFQSGNPYGDPLNFPDAHCNPAAGFSPSGCTPLPTGKTFYGGNGLNPYTSTFDAPGSLRGPSWWTVNLAVSHDIGHNLKASILGTNLLAGVHNHGYPWELATNQTNISYADNLFYNAAPLGGGAGIQPAPAQAYYGNNYYPYVPAGVLPYRDYVFSVSAKI
ncbi:MAG: TonB-dependent receptor [Candidatus Eremiobacteraeota bacterium]|nr:TonB-dependent receptor [Candidatus Eremiobacteraeota bacterium]